MATIKVKPNEEKPVSVEVIVDAIVAIGEGVKKLRPGRLNDKAIVLLIARAIPRTYQVSETTVCLVLDGMESLEKQFLKPKKQ